MRWCSRRSPMASRSSCRTSRATRIHSYNIEKTNRLYVATLQTLSNCFEKFTPGFFDLIFFDEVHRSIFNKFNEVIQYFDARMIGLTATPAEFIDRDTFRVFDCDGKPHLPLHLPAGHQGRIPGGFRSLQRPDRLPAQGHPRGRPDRRRAQHPDRAGARPRRIDFAGTELEGTSATGHAPQAVGRDLGDVPQGPSRGSCRARPSSSP